MKKQTVVVGVIVAAIIAGGIIFVSSNDNETINNTSSPAPSSTTTEETVTETKPQLATGKYVTLAEYNANQENFKDSKKVYFFHASWCPICKSIDEQIVSNPSAIPDGTTIIKTNFDTSTDLRKKYGVTYQYTFVQIDNNGNETAQWTATTLEKALSGIK